MIVKRTFFLSLCAVLLMGLGLLVMLSWHVHFTPILSIIPGSINMVFNSAVCFLLSGIILFLSPYNFRYQNHIFIIIGGIIFVLAALTIIEYAFVLSLGIDELFVKVWIHDENPFAGRMALNTSIAFSLVGICFILFPFSYKKIPALLLEIIIFLIMLLGISAFLGYLLKLEFLYSWYLYTRMALHTCIGMIILSAGLWAVWSNSNNFSNLYYEHEDKKIILISTMILIGIGIISGLAGFNIAYNPVEKQIELIVIILAIALSTGIWLLRWQVLPLVRQLVRTKKEAISSNLNLQAIFNHAAEGIFCINDEGKIESFNPAATKMFGYSSSEILGKNFKILISKNQPENSYDELQKYLKTRQSEIIGKHRFELTGIRKNNEKFPMELAITEMQIEHDCKFVGIMHDISNRKANEAAILESEERFRSAFDYSPVGMALVSLEGRWLKVNNALCKIVGYSESELLDMNFRSIIHPDDLEETLKHVNNLRTGKISFYRIEERYIRKDKKPTWISLIGSVIHDLKGKPLYYIEQIQDINDRKEQEQELSFKAYYDTLTGLVNRNQLEHSLDLTIATALRHQQRFAIFFIDLDNFKQINDSLGHDIGDQLLKVVGSILRDSIRKTDIAARLGGDEFILVLNGTNNPETAAILAEKILNILLKPIVIKGHELFISASIGISFYPADGTDYKSLIKSADLALYKAKERGRNNYQFCTPEMNNEIIAKLSFKNALQAAIKNKEFHLVFLPKMDGSNHVTGFEALLRWKSPKYGEVSPAKVIPLAEEMGIISQLSNWIIGEAGKQALQWVNDKKIPLKLTINISTKHYFQANFTDNILQIIKKINLSPHYLALEINESLIMQDPDYSLKLISDLKNNGIQIIIDNFGIGYSSLNYLSQFAVDYIKIAREFIQNIIINQKNRELTTAIIALAKNLNIKIIAAGIESQEQYELLRQLGCDELQGYYISQPLIAEDVGEFLEKYRERFK